MRYLLVVILGFGLATAGIFLPWGDKQVVRGECDAIFDSRSGSTTYRCDMSSVDALYWSDHLTADLRTWETIDGTIDGDVDWVREFHDYDASGTKLDGNGGLFWGRPILWFSIGTAAFALGLLVASRKRDDAFRWTAVWTLVAAGTLLAMGTILGLGGMVLHAATWAGTFVQRLSPRPGSLLLLGGAVMGIYGTIRYSQAESMRLRGISYGSPLATILEIEAPEPEKVEKADKAPLLWNGRTFLLIAALTLALPALFAPMAHKDVTLVDCQQFESGWVCVERHYEVDYRMANAALDVTQQNETAQRIWSYPFFKAQFGGPAHLGQGLWIYGAGVAALLVGTGHQAMARRHPPRRTKWVLLATTTLFVVALAIAMSAIVMQALAWAGQPAGHLRPRWGIFLALLAAGLAIWATWGSWRRPYRHPDDSA